MLQCHNSLQTYPVECVPVRHIRENDLIADAQSGADLDGVDGGCPKLHLHPRRRAVRLQPEEADGALVLSERGPADVEHIAKTLKLDRPVDAQVWTCPFRQR